MIQFDTRLIVKMAIGFAVALVLFALYFFITTRDDHTEFVDNNEDMNTLRREEIQRIASDVSGGKQLSVVKGYEDILNKADQKAPETSYLKLDYAIALSNQGEDGIRRAYSVIREVLEDPLATPSIQSQALNVALNIYSADDNAIKMALLLESPFFEGKNIPGHDISLQFRRVAEIANDLRPSSLGLLREAFWYAQQLLDNKNLTPELQDAYSQKIVVFLEKSETLSSEVEYSKTAPLDYVRIHNYMELHFQAFLLSALTMHDQQYVEEMKEKYDTLFAIVSANSEDMKLAEFAVYSYFYYAATLYAVDPILYKDSIDTALDQLLALVLKIEEKIEGSIKVSFIYFAQQEYLRPKELQLHNYMFFVNLANHSESFKALLQMNGWVFNESQP